VVLAALAAVLVLLTGPRPAAHADSFTVTTTSDALGACSAGSCPSLRAAIQRVNALHAMGVTATHTITLLGGVTYFLTLRGLLEDSASTGDLDIRANVTITTTPGGGVASIQGAAGWDDRIFDVFSNRVAVRMENLLIKGGGKAAVPSHSEGAVRNLGVLTLSNTIVSDNTNVGIVNFAPFASLTLINSAVSNNSGSGISNLGDRVELTNSTVSGNTADFDGGGIWNNGSLTLNNSTVSGNTARGNISSGGSSDGNGGGIFNSGILTLNNSTVSGNTARGNGGGIANDQGTMTLINSTVSGNTLGPGRGGGISNTGSLAVVNSTISGNTTLAGGGGIANEGTMVANNTTITQNVAADTPGAGGGIFNGGTVNLVNTILAGNFGGGIAGGADCAGTLTSQGFNLIGRIDDRFCPITGTTTGNRTGDPLLGSLRFNGGATLTHHPLAGSPAIDTGNPAGGPNSCNTVDQRNFKRPVDGDLNGSARCDIGAVEALPSLGCLCLTKTGTPLGTLRLVPDTATVAVGEPFAYALQWTVPAGGWRRLATLGLRLVEAGHVVFWVRFQEAAEPPGLVGTWHLVDPQTGGAGPAFVPGSLRRLRAQLATMLLAQSGVQGPPGARVGLTLALRFKARAAGRRFALEVLATDDAGAETGAIPAGTLRVLTRRPDNAGEGHESEADAAPRDEERVQQGGRAAGGR
jgi:hypothetical protein